MNEPLKMELIRSPSLIVAKYSGDGIKRISFNRFEGHAIRWHDPYRQPDNTGNGYDLTGEWFSPKTNRMLKAGYPIVGAPVNYQHGQHKDFGATGIGLLDFTDEDEIGQFVKGELYTREQYIEMLKEIGRLKEFQVSDAQYAKRADLALKAVQTLVNEVPLQFSGGFDPSTWIVNEQTKHIDQSGLIHLGFTPTPADDLNPIISFKSMFTEAFNLEHERKTFDMSPPAPPAKEDTHPIEREAETVAKTVQTPINSKQGTKAMNPELIKELIAMLQGMLAEQGAPEEEAMAMANEVASDLKADPELLPEEGKAVDEELVKAWMSKAIAKAQVLMTKRQSAVNSAKSMAEKAANDWKANQPLNPNGTHGLPRFTGNDPHRNSVGEERKFAHLSASDMALGIVMKLSPAKSQGIHVNMKDAFSESYLRTFANKAAKFADSDPYTKGSLAKKSFGHWQQAQSADNTLKSLIPFKANELNASDIATQGAEWVSEWWATDLWERERFERHYDALVSRGMMVQTIPQGADTAHFPTEGSDPVAYVAPQANSVGADGRPETTANFSPYTTGVVDCTPLEIKLATSQTVILEEDSIINVVQNVNRQLNEAALETRDKLLVNGDDSLGTTNINYDGATVPAGLQRPYYTAADGFRLHGLTNNAVDASNTLALESYRLTLAELDPELRQYYERMLFFIDPTTEMASLAIPEIATDDVRRNFATVTSGRILNVYGVDVRVNGFIPQTDTDGKVTASGNVANRGTILLVYAPYWGFAYKRQITLETARNIYSGTNDYVMSMRIGMVARGTNATALTYNVATAIS